MEFEFDLENPLTISDDNETPISELFVTESDHMSNIAAGDLDLPARRDAGSLILQAQFSCNLDPFVAYLAVNYAHRFLCKREIPKGKPWIVRLLCISCLSLASKMKNTNLPFPDLQMEEGFIFDAQTIQRMELLVLGALEWRMRSITPFSFIRFFLAFFNPFNPPLLRALKSRASQILLRAQNEIKMLEFKPSVIAAAALISAADELFPLQLAAFQSAIASSEFVNKEKLRECCDAMSQVAAEETISSSDSPATVLCHRCSSSESERTVRSSSDGCRGIKKSRISGRSAAENGI